MIERVPATLTYELRHRVLGRGSSPADIEVDEDRDPQSGHFAHRSGGQIVAVGTIRRKRAPTGADPAWQIRGMAVDPAHRGQGLGSSVLQALLDHAATRGGGVVWCDARIAARTLYERHGFRVDGEPFEDPEAGTQVLMIRREARGG
jgi:ribosomal protein S18 acetylase RimI-like enzyme